MNNKRIFCIVILIFNLFLFSNSFAVFTLSGSTITQTGLDTDLSGLNIVSGVTVISEGTGTNQFNVYDIGNRQLRIQGTLTINPTNEQLLFGTSSPANSLLIQNGGILNLGIDKTVNSATYQTTGKGIIIPNSGLPACCSNGALTVQNGGTLNWKGATIQLASVMFWEANSVINISNGKLINTRGPLIRIRSYSTNLDVNGFEVEGGDSIDFFNTPVRFLGYNPKYGQRSTEIVSSQSGGSDSLFIFRNYNSEGLQQDFSVWRGADSLFINLAKEGDINNRHNDGGNGQKGLTRVSKEVQINVKDVANNNLENVRYYIKDYNNGNRLNRIPRSGFNYNLDLDKVYTGSTDSNGDTGIIQILTRVGYSTSQGNNNLNNIWDYRSKNNNNEDIFDINLLSYLHLNSLITLPFKGSNVLDINWILFEDTLITELDKSIVDSYTELENSAKFYDRAKAYLIDNYDGENQTLVTRNEDTIQTTYDIIINPSAPQVFSFNGTHITIRTSTFNGNIETSESVSLQNGAQVTGLIVDENFDPTTVPLEFRDVKNGTYIYARYTSNNSMITSQKVNADGNYFFQIQRNESIYYFASNFGSEIEFGTQTHTPDGIVVTLENRQMQGINRTLSQVQSLTSFSDLDDVYAYLSYYKSLGSGFSQPTLESVFAVKAGNLLVFNVQNVEFSASALQLVSYNQGTDTLFLKSNPIINQSPSLINVYSPFNISYSGVTSNFQPIGGIEVINYTGLGELNVTLTNLPTSAVADSKCFLLDRTSGASQIVNINSTGQYRFVITPPRRYDIYCDALGYERKVVQNVLFDGFANVELDFSLELLRDENNNNLYGFGDVTQANRVGVDLSNHRLYYDSGITNLSYRDVVDGVERTLNQNSNLNYSVLFSLKRDRIEVNNPIFKIAPSNSATSDVIVNFLSYDRFSSSFDNPYVSNGGFNIIRPNEEELIRDYNRNYNLVLDEFRVYEDALTDFEIKQLYNDELRYRTLNVTSVVINSTTGDVDIDVVTPFSISGKDINYEVYYNKR